MSTANQPPTSGLIPLLTRNRKAVAYGFLVIAVAFLGLAAYVGFQHGRDYWRETALSLGVGVAFLGLGLWQLQDPHALGLGERKTTHFVVLIAGGVLGLALVLLSIDFGYRWWEVLSGGPDKWREEPAKLIGVIGGMLAGLAVLFVSLSVARAEDEDDPTLRRLLYGYSTVLAGLLLFGILLILNVLAYLRLPQPSDWTTDQIYTLSPKSQEILRNLEKPVRVVAIFATRQDVGRHPGYYQDVSNLLKNAAAVGRKFSYREVMRGLQPVEMGELREKYFVDEEGLLVIYGEAKDEIHQFIKQDDLYEAARGRGGREGFKGEDALMSTIAYLAEGKTKSVVYFTQGNGELDISGGMMGGRPERGASELVRELEKNIYEVKRLFLGLGGRQSGPRDVVSDKVPDDAAAVIVAGPQQPLSPEAVDALRKYMAGDDKKKGRLIVLAGPTADPDGRPRPTGLEPLLTEYSVELGQGRVLSLASQQAGRYPGVVVAYPNPRLADRNSIVTYLLGPEWQQFPRRVRAYSLTDVRPVRPRRAAPMGGGASQAHEVLEVSEEMAVWAEEDFREDPEAMIRNLMATKEGRQKLASKLSQEPIPIAVAVSESKGASNPADPHGGMFGGGEERPRMVVIGNVSYFSDAALQRGGRSAESAVGFIASSLAWLRERPNSLNIAARTRKDYEMSPDTDLGQMVFLPGILMASSVIGIGLGVWLVRRR